MRMHWMVVVVVLAMTSCRSQQEPEAPSIDPDGVGTLGEVVQRLVAQNAIKPRTEDEPPCPKGDIVACESRCLSQSGWGCVLAADALRKSGDARKALTFYRRACFLTDPDGCAEIGVHDIVTTAGHGSSRLPFARVYLACEIGRSERACNHWELLAARETWQTDERDHTDWNELREARDQMQQVACDEFHQEAACRVRVNNPVLCSSHGDADACAKVAEEEKNREEYRVKREAQDKIDEAERVARLADCERKHPGDCREDGFQRSTYVIAPRAPSPEPTAWTPPAPTTPSAPTTPAKPSIKPGHLSPEQCSSMMSYVCTKLEVEWRRAGMNDEHALMDQRAACFKDNKHLQDFCETVTCGERWLRCMTYESASSAEFNACSRHAHNC